MAENKGQNKVGREKGYANLRPKKKGDPASENAGRPKGSLSAKTIYEAVGELTVPDEIRAKLAEEGITVTEKSIEKAIAYVVAMRALKGHPSMVKEYNDRRYGKAPQDVNLNANVTGNVILNFEKKPRQNGE